MAATVMQALMAQMQPWPGQLERTELTVASAALAAQVAKAVLAVRVQKPVLIQPAATAAQLAPVVTAVPRAATVEPRVPPVPEMPLPQVSYWVCTRVGNSRGPCSSESAPPPLR